MQNIDPLGPSAGSVRGYFTGLACGAALLAIHCIFNVLVDPTGAFGLSGRFAFNRAPPPQVVTYGESTGDPAFYSRAIRESRATKYLIGQSRTWRGFDTCVRPDMLRVAGSAWEISQLEQVQRTVLSTRQAPVIALVEIGLPQEEPMKTSSFVRGLSVAMSPQTTYFSILTVVASMRRQRSPNFISCRPHASPPENWPEALRTLRAALTYVNASKGSLLQGRRNVLAMADAADRICENTGLRHRIIYFSLPATPSQSPATALDQKVRENSQAIATLFARRAVPTNGCFISYRNFTTEPPGTTAQQAMWHERAYWSDYAHYSPALGEVAMDVLLR